MARLRDKTALVIGAGSVGEGWSNGKATAVQFAREGARVVCFDRNAEAAHEVAQIIRDEGGEVMAIPGDATNSADIASAVEACTQRFGGIDVLHNNVGIVVNGGVVEMDEDEWDRVFAVNLKSAYLAMKHVIPHMAGRGGGAIVNVSSVSSIRHLGAPYASYYTSKAGLNHLTRVTAVEYAPQNIRVNAVLPGLMDTPMAARSAVANHGVAPEKLEEAWAKKAARVPMGFMGDAWDVAKAAAFLASDDARYITGVCLTVDGGLTLKS